MGRMTNDELIKEFEKLEAEVKQRECKHAMTDVSAHGDRRTVVCLRCGFETDSVEWVLDRMLIE